MPTSNNKERPRLAVIDYGMGNLCSVVKGWNTVGADAYLANEPDAIGEADAVVFPGQGAMVDAMRRLKETGFDQVVRDWVAADKPFFGICLGLQALFEHSEEGDCAGLGIFKGSVRRFDIDTAHKIPHMGWNSIYFKDAAPLTEGFESGVDQFYFVHSYHIVPADPSIVWFETDYGGTFASGVQRGRCFATQFHPEKSQSKGLQLYANFLLCL